MLINTRPVDALGKERNDVYVWKREEERERKKEREGKRKKERKKEREREREERATLEFSFLFDG